MATLNNHYTTSDLNHLRSEVVLVPPEMAAMLRATCHFDRQRAIDPRNVERLAFEIKQGWFIRGTPISMCVLPDGTMRLINGNHTLEAIKKAGIPVPLTFLYQEVPDLAAVARDYSNLDLQKGRSWKTALHAVNGGHNEFDGRATAALGAILSEFGKNAHNQADSRSRGVRVQMLNHEYRAAINLLAATTKGCPSQNVSKLMRSAVLGVALITARAQPAKAVEFWGGMVRDDGIAAGDPRKALLRYLFNNPVAGSGARPAHARIAANAWNAFYEGRDLEFVRQHAASPLRIAGTPWHKGNPDRSQEVAAPGNKPQAPLFETGVVHSATGQPSTVVRYAKPEGQAPAHA